jgi:hypothetical protein
VISRATFQLADGQTLPGSPGRPNEAAKADRGDISATQPVMFLPDGTPVSFWNANLPSGDELRGLYSALGKPSASVFPITYRLQAEHIGRPFIGNIRGFCALDLQTSRVVVTR